MRKNSEFIRKFRRSVLHPLVYGAITGAAVGSIVALFVTCAKVVISFALGLYENADGPLTVVCMITCALICCLLTAIIQTLVPSSKGSGIPLAEAAARGMISVKWLRSAAALIVGSLAAFLCGMPLGSEGPSVGVGGLIGDGVGKLFKKPVEFRRYLITGGASAGLASAFNAPLTGICFAFEETHRRFSPYILSAALSAVVTAVASSQAVFYGFGHIEYLYSLGIRAGAAVLPRFELSQYASTVDMFKVCLVALVCGIVCAGLGVGFNRAIGALGKLTGKIKSTTFRLLPAFAATAVCGLCLHYCIGSGEATLEHITENSALWLLFTVLAVRFLLTTLASGSGATGGLFLPMIAIGGLTGLIAARISTLCGIPAEYTPNIVMLCICAFFAATVRAPITAVALSVELTASFANLLPCVAAIAIAAVLADLVKTEPLYEKMLEDLQAATPLPAGNKNIVLSGVLSDDSPIAYKRVRNILWPYNSLVTDLIRNGEELVPDGETVLKPNDRITIHAERVDPDFFRNQIGEYIELDNAERVILNSEN